MNRREKLWFLWMAVVVGIDLLPFWLFKDNGTFRGAFMLWTVLTVSVALSGLLYTTSWGRRRKS